jgi:hypothetical protein
VYDCSSGIRSRRTELEAVGVRVVIVDFPPFADPVFSVFDESASPEEEQPATPNASAAIKARRRISQPLEWHIFKPPTDVNHRYVILLGVDQGYVRVKIWTTQQRSLGE